jgi:toxin ParE1/3/4
MRLRYTLRAQADLEDIFGYLDQRSPTHAQAVRAEIERRVGQLRDFPLMAPATDMPGVRELPLTRFPYRIYYEVRDDEVRVLHIRDTRRRPWLRRG